MAYNGPPGNAPLRRFFGMPSPNVAPRPTPMQANPLAGPGPAARGIFGVMQRLHPAQSISPYAPMTPFHLNALSGSKTFTRKEVHKGYRKLK